MKPLATKTCLNCYGRGEVITNAGTGLRKPCPAGCKPPEPKEKP